MLKRGDEVSVTVDRLAYGGRAVGRLEGFVVFVAGAAPNEVVRARIVRARRRYAEAEVVAVEAPSADRTEPRCPHFGPCGGCAWQHVSYAAQASAKEAIVRESLAHLGGIAEPVVHPIVPAPDPWYYRNKMEFSFHPDGVLGLHRRGEWNRIVSIEACFLQSLESVALVETVRTFTRRHGLKTYDPKSRAGLLRSLVIREARGTGDRLVGLVTSSGPFDGSTAFVEQMVEAAPGVTGIVRGIVNAPSEGAPPSAVEILHGSGILEERVLGLRFLIGLDTFFQTNTAQAARMIEYVVARAQPLASARVVDLYCGVGTFALPLARAGGRVVGIELMPASVSAAAANAALNGLDGVVFTAGDARLMLPAAVAAHGTPDVLVLDPPRAGAGGKVMRKIGRSGARRIIYVSCNPTTLAPDLKEVLPLGYRLVDVQPFDLFPQTHHVEAIAVLDRRG